MGPNEPWWDDLVRRGLAGEREQKQWQAQRQGMAFADLDRVVIDDKAVRSIPSKLARELRTLPVKLDGRTLWVVQENLNSGAVDCIKEHTGFRVIPVLCLGSALDEALGRLD